MKQEKSSWTSTLDKPVAGIAKINGVGKIIIPFIKTSVEYSKLNPFDSNTWKKMFPFRQKLYTAFIKNMLKPHRMLLSLCRIAVFQYAAQNPYRIVIIHIIRSQ